MDTFSKSQRSAIMQKVASKNTKPELVVRSVAHRLGYRFRLHRADLPGKPDITFPSRQKIIFVHGCFWHGHSCRAGQNRPQSNTEYWDAKLERTKARDEKNLRELNKLGWQTLTLWECETKKTKSLAEKIKKFLG